MKRKLLIGTSYIIALIFVVFAFLQWNDPDPYIWIPIYMLVVILALIAPFRNLNRLMLWMVAGGYLIGAYYLWPGTYKGITMPMSQYQPEIELARESLGLLIAFFAVIYLSFISAAIHRQAGNSR
jgi:hypothetical protein